MSNTNHVENIIMGTLARLDHYKAGECNITELKKDMRADVKELHKAGQDGAVLVYEAIVAVKKPAFDVDAIIVDVEKLFKEISGTPSMDEQDFTEDQLAELEEVTDEMLQDIIDGKDPLDSLAERILFQLDIAANAHITIGKHLHEARELHDSQKSFLEWSLAETGLKKSQVYNLMKVSKEFGDVECFEGVPMRVLLRLCGVSDEVKEEAATLAEQGNLNGGTVESLFGESTGNEGEELQPDTQEQEPEAETSNALDTGAAGELESLRKLLQEVQKQNAELTKQLAQANKKVHQLTCLPHFRSANMAIRLGLEAGADAKAVRASYRTTVKVFNAEACPEAFELLTEARDSLLSTAKAGEKAA